MTDELKPCPCGAIPEQLGIAESPSGAKWAMAICDSCGEWQIEFRTQYHKLNTKECMKLAIEAWNRAPRLAE